MDIINFIIRESFLFKKLTGQDPKFIYLGMRELMEARKERNLVDYRSNDEMRCLGFRLIETTEDSHIGFGI